ncbi:Annexin D3 [Dichanthelium oligosanthes]|uniref:Annexin n=1 Tax=Dichanthelium oligosanthes TaxID=888268 RepID=A0A1E5W0U2_9POAL|nr:Annexin D3 [Dichanthelium oligosanthes]
MSTVAVPSPPPTASEDAESLRKALQGNASRWRADKAALIGILCRRTAAQRAAIRRAYAFLYREPLLNCFRYKLSRHCLLSVDFWVLPPFIRHDHVFQKALILWTMDPAERDANLVHEAVKKKDENYILVLIEVSCASTPDHLMAVRKIYHKLFSCSIEEDVASSPALQEPLKTMLVSLVSSYRYAGEHVDMDVAKLEATQLSEAIREKQLRSDEVVRIISTRSKSQLRATFQQYKEDHGTDIGEDINSHCSSSQLGRMLKSAVWCLASPEKHFAQVIRYSILGLGTYEDILTRVIVSRAEIDMKQIKEEYRARYKSAVAPDVAGDTSFGYRDMLLALVGSED